MSGPGRSTFLMALLATALTVSCGGEPSGPPPPTPGTVLVTLDGARAEDEALLIEVGPGATGVSAARGGLDVHTWSEAGEFTVAVFGPLSGGAVLSLDVSDVESLPTLQVREVADGLGALQDVDGYSAIYQDTP